MNPIVLAFAGAIASGKTALSQQVAETLGWPWASFGDYVRRATQQRGLDVSSRYLLQQVSDELIRGGWTTFCQGVLEQVNWHLGSPLVIDGIRHVEAFSTIRTLVFPQQVRLVLIDVPEAVRDLRLQARGVETNEQRHYEHHSSEVQVVQTLPALAQRIVDGTKPLDVSTRSIVAWVQHDAVNSQ